MADIVEPILEAAKIVAEKLISEVRFDQTVKATIVNDSNAYRGEYLVSTGNATFTAYCADDKYKKDDAVLVTVPEGDYKNQKVIIGKQVDDTNSVIHKLSPFQSITDVTGNLISKFVYDNNQLKTADAIYANMYANGKQNDPDFNYFSWDYGISDFIASDVYNRSLTLINFPNQNSSAVGGTENSTITSTVDHPGLIWDSGVINQPGYTRLGLQAQFKTWLGDYNIVHGHYGLMLQVQFKIVEELDDNSQSVDYFYKYLDFSNEDFFGDSYNFETFYTQEKVFDLTEFVDYPITRLRLFAYEREDFLTMENIPIEYFGVGGITTAGYNIFIKDPYICLGFDANEYQGDTALICPIENSSIIYTKDISNIQLAKNFINEYTAVLGELNAAIEEEEDHIPVKNIIAEAITQLKEFQENETVAEILNKYEKQLANNTKEFSYYDEDIYNLRDQENKKIIELRWVHKDEEKEIIKLMANGEVPPHYFIQWYRYKLGAKSPDQFAGAHWVRFYGTVDNVRGNAELENTGIEETLDANSNDLNLDSGRAAFEEKRRALQNAYTQAIKDLYKAENTNEAVAAKNVLGSQLAAIDTATNTTRISFYPNPNYAEEKFKVIIVKQDPYSNHLTKIAESNVLIFTNQTDIRSEATIIDENALSIKYSDDEKGVYLIYDRSGHIGKEEQGEVRTLTAVFDEDISNVNDKPDLNNYTSIKWIFPDNNTMIIPMQDEATTASTTIFENTITVYYTIKKTLNRNAINNTVRLEVIKDGLEYTAQAQMIFGTAGTSGSDYTVFIEWDNNQNAIIKQNDGNNNITYKPLIGTIHLMDQSGSLVDDQLPDDLDIQLDWYQLSPTDDNNKSIAKETNLDFKYPINNNGNLLTSTDTTLVDFNNNYYIETPYNGTNFYFDMSTGNFSTSLQGQQAYGVVQITDQDNPEANCKNKIIFKPVDEAYNSDAGSLIKDNNDKIIYAWNSNKRLFVKYKDVYIIDPWDSFQETETYYYPANSTEYTYSNSSYLTINQEQNNKRKFTINVNQDPIDSLHILRVTFNNFGDYQLVALFPIPIKYEMQINDVGNNTTAQTLFKVDYINGPTEVRYSTGGEVDFNKNAYEICCRKYNNATGFDVVKHNNESITLPGYWKLLYSIDSENSSNIENILPSLAEYIDDGEGHKQLYTDYRLTKENDQHEIVDISFNIPWLQPLGVYYKDAPLYGVQFKTNEAITIDFNNNDPPYTIPAETILWTQPILCYQDNYPSTTLNKWNGKEIQIDEDNGTIVANGMAAGKKESDNTFTGVVIGDWSRTDVDSFISKNTGVYGFNHGAMSYAFKDDGTAFLGKDGHGRIYFNGNKATIYSAGWVANSANKSGMLLDVDDGVIKIISPNSNKTNFLINDGTTDLIKIGGNNEYILQSHGFSSTAGSEQGVQLNLGTGSIIGYNFTIKAKKSSFTDPLIRDNIVKHYNWNEQATDYNYFEAVNFDATSSSNYFNSDSRPDTEDKTLIISSQNENYPLTIGRGLRISWNGLIDAQGGRFNDLTATGANFTTLNVSRLQATTGTISSLYVTGTISMANGGSITGSGTGSSFNLGSSGKLTATGVEITGEINANSGTFDDEVVVGSYLKVGNYGIIGDTQSGDGSGSMGIGACYVSRINNETIDTNLQSYIKATSTNVGITYRDFRNMSMSSYVSADQYGVTIGGPEIFININNNSMSLAAYIQSFISNNGGSSGGGGEDGPIIIPQ